MFTFIIDKIKSNDKCKNVKYLLNNFITSEHCVQNLSQREIREYFMPFSETVLNQFREINISGSEGDRKK